MHLSMYKIDIIRILYTLIFYMCRLYYNLRAVGGLRSAGWETLRACKELGFTSVSGWSKSPSHSCGLKSVAFLHTARGGRWCGRRREAPSPVLLLLLSDPLPSSRQNWYKNSRVWTYFHRLDWLPAVITSWSSKWRIVPLCWLFFGVHSVLTYGQVKPLLFLFQSIRTCRLNWNEFFEVLTELERGPQFSSTSRIFNGEGGWLWDYIQFMFDFKNDVYIVPRVYFIF